MKTLLTMMTYKRGHETESEADFISAFIDPIAGVQRDAFGNRYLRIGKNPTTLFSAHMDTVHRITGMQKVVFDRFANVVYKDDGSALGADNAAGMWILFNLIVAKKPGLYIFHRAEECGGQGSRHIAATTPELLKGIKRAVAFDRRGYRDVITHQRGGIRGCSQDFADALCEALQMDHEPCDRGSFTDTASYFHLVPECTNISVGYHDEHTANEWLNLNYLEALNRAVLALDWESLPTARVPVEEKPLVRTVAALPAISPNYSEAYYKALNPQNQPTGTADLPFADMPNPDNDEDLASVKLLEEFITKYPLEALEMLQDCGITATEVKDAMMNADYAPFLNPALEQRH